VALGLVALGFLHLGHLVEHVLFAVGFQFPSRAPARLRAPRPRTRFVVLAEFDARRVILGSSIAPLIG
jgi:hypothetical protein